MNVHASFESKQAKSHLIMCEGNLINFPNMVDIYATFLNITIRLAAPSIC